VVLLARLEEANVHGHDQPMFRRSVAQDDGAVGRHLRQLEVFLRRGELLAGSKIVLGRSEAQCHHFQQSPGQHGTSFQAGQQATQGPGSR
jgi:hypothetical protein